MRIIKELFLQNNSKILRFHNLIYKNINNISLINNFSIKKNAISYLFYNLYKFNFLKIINLYFSKFIKNTKNNYKFKLINNLFSKAFFN
jgi:hypothetical protein